MYSDIIIITNTLKRSANLSDMDIKTAFYGERHDMPIRKLTVVVGPEECVMTPGSPDEHQYLNETNDRIRLKISVRIYAPKKEKGEVLAKAFERVGNVIRKEAGYATELSCANLEFSTPLAAVCLPCFVTLEFLRAPLT